MITQTPISLVLYEVMNEIITLKAVRLEPAGSTFEGFQFYAASCKLWEGREQETYGDHIIQVIADQLLKN